MENKFNNGEIEKLITSYTQQSIDGLDKENPKFDFKSIWYDLTSIKGINEFLKDTASMVNTFGPDGYIVIGFDDKAKEFKPALFKDSKLKDSSEIINLINKKVDKLFEINTIDIDVNGNKLSVIHIPPSTDKPHVIRNYQTIDRNGDIKEDMHRIFVRKNSQVVIASKYDIELMYYDRKNITPDYKLLSNFNLKTTNFNIKTENSVRLSINLAIENMGRRTVAISSIKINLSLDNDPLTFVSDLKHLGANLIIKSGEILNEVFELVSPIHYKFSNSFLLQKVQEYNQEKEKINLTNAEITLSNGSILNTELVMVK